MADTPEHISVDEEKHEEKSQTALNDFPEGGRRAWFVAVGCAGLLFCTFGFANAFG